MSQPAAAAAAPASSRVAALAYCPIPDATVQLPAVLHLAADGITVDPLVGTFRGRHLLSVADLTRAEIDRLMRVADWMALGVAGPGSVELAKGCILTALFYEPSTRTSSSFQAAMMRLGGQVIVISDMANSSVSKGETLEDTVRCVQCYTNIIAMRHPETGAALRASKVLNVPLINAGDGTGEHPTQALLDLYTIQGELGHVDGLTVTMVGDLKNGRTVHSLAKLLTHFSCKLRFVSPDSLRMPQYVLDILSEHKIEFSQHSALDKVLCDSDILYGQEHG
jgi:aspartate carbamoyltransferase